MTKSASLRAFAIVPLALLCSLLAGSIASADGTRGEIRVLIPVSSHFAGPVPKAHCAPGDHTESGLQGQTTAQERFSGDSERGYNCNVKLVGRYRGEGVYSQDGPAYDGDCAYMGTDNVTPLQQHHGVVVVDASDPRHPRPTAYLDDTAAALDPHETLLVNERRHLLVVAEQMGRILPFMTRRNAATRS